MFNFTDDDDSFTTRIPDRPARRIPVAISTMPEIPWLASKYVPKQRERASVRQLVSKGVRTAIPLLGTLAVIGFLGFLAITLFSQY